MNSRITRDQPPHDALAAAALLVTASILAAPGPAAAGIGDIDVRFGNHGVVEFDRQGPVHIEQQPDGRLLVLAHPESGMGGNDPSQLELRRYLPNGLVDMTFGDAGRRVVRTPGGDPAITDAAMQPDGKLVIGGAASVGAESWVRYLARVDGSGTPDSTFGTGGLVNGGTLARYHPGYHLIRVLPDGDIVALINDADGDPSNGSDAVMDRFDRDGRRVSSSTVEGTPIAVGAPGNGDIVLAAQTTAGMRVMRLRRDGTTDDAFGTHGSIALPGWYGSVGVLASPAGLVLCGSGEVRRFDSSGRPDPGFGPDGSGAVSLETMLGLRLGQCNGLLPNPAGGTYVVASDVQGTFAVLRGTVVIALDSDGELEPRFGSGAGFTRLRDLQAPDEQWRVRELFETVDGNARVVWNYVSSRQSGLRVDAIDFGQGNGPGAVGIARGHLRVREGTAYLELDVVRNGRPLGAASLRYETTLHSADEADITPLAGTLHWADGDASSRKLRLALTNDSLVEGEETVSLRTVDATGASTPPDPVVVTIADDDALRALRFREERITWTTGPGIPVESWPVWSLNRADTAPGRVTAHYYFSNGFDACCIGTVTWNAGETGDRTIAPYAGESLGAEFQVIVIDEAWEDAGPFASVKVVVDPTPPNSAGGGSNPGSEPSGGGSARGEAGGGGGAVGLLESTLLGGLAIAATRRRTRRSRAVAHSAFG